MSSLNVGDPRNPYPTAVPAESTQKAATDQPRGTEDESLKYQGFFANLAKNSGLDDVWKSIRF